MSANQISKFVLIVESHEARSGYNNTVLTESGDRFLVVDEPEGWVEATSAAWTGSLNDSNGFPHEPKLFESVGEAAAFAKRWEGHPWWCKPNGKYEILEMRPAFKQVQDGYEMILKAAGEK